MGLGGISMEGLGGCIAGEGLGAGADEEELKGCNAREEASVGFLFAYAVGEWME
jgi:hypothetical protein